MKKWEQPQITKLGLEGTKEEKICKDSYGWNGCPNFSNAKGTNGALCDYLVGKKCTFVSNS